MVLLLNRCMGAAGLWAGRPSWRGVLACQTSLCTPDVEIPVSTCRLTGVRDSVGKGSTSPVGDGRPLVPLDTAGMVPLSPVVDGYLPCRPSIPLSGHHEERYRRPAT